MGASDPFDLQRFVDAQGAEFNRALEEVRAGRKQTHWMWYVFPQFERLGITLMSHRFAIRSLEEARAYLAHPQLGARLAEISAAVAGVDGRTAREIFGTPDDLKLRSSMTLFALVSPAGSVFHRVLDKYFGGEPDPRTVELSGSVVHDARRPRR